MFSVPFTVIFGFLKNAIVGLFSNVKVLIAVAVIAFVGYMLYKYNAVNEQVRNVTKELNESQTANTTLRNTITDLDIASKQKDATIKFLASESERQHALIESLTKKNKKVQGDVDKLKSELDKITTKPTSDVGPYLKNALEGVKTLREAK